MKQWKVYTNLQIKRAFRAFPGVLVVSLLMLIAVGSLFFVEIKVYDTEKKDATTKITVGIVGEGHDDYLNVGIDTIRQIDSSRYSVNFIYIDTVEEAREKMQESKISAYMVIPDGFIQSLVNGTNRKIPFVIGSAQAGLGTRIISELTQAVSAIIMDTQAGIYSLQDYYRIYNGKNEAKFEKELNVAYLSRILEREDMYHIVEVDDSGSELSTGGYYLTSLLLFFLLLWGSGVSYLYIREDDSMQKMLTMTGTRPVRTLLADAIALFLLLFSSLFVLGIGLSIFGDELKSLVPEAETLKGIGTFFYLVKILPVLLFVVMLQMLLTEIVRDLISGLLLQFLLAVGISYLSGCFYPIIFFLN